MLRDRLQEIINQAQAALAELPEDKIIARNSDELRIALNNGGEINLLPGTTYNGNFVITKPTVINGVSAALSPLGKFLETLSIQSSDVVIKNLTINNGHPDVECVLVGSHSATNAALQPHNVRFEQVDVVASPDGGRRGFSLHGSNITLFDCNVFGFWYVGRDAQAVWINNGAGPYIVDSCYLEGSGENLMVGGDRLRIGQNPADILITNNVFHKPQSWRNKRGSVKNLLEFKAGERITVTNNNFDGCWVDAQGGSAIVITPRNQYGDNPFVRVNEVSIRNNVIKNCPDGFGVNILGSDDLQVSQPMIDMTVHNNLFLDTPYGMQVGNAAALNLSATNNSFLGITRHFLSFYGPTLASLSYVSNVVRSGLYGARRDDAGLGTPTLLASARELLFTDNVIEQPELYNIKYPANNRLIPYGQLAGLLGPDGKLLDRMAGYYE